MNQRYKEITKKILMSLPYLGICFRTRFENARHRIRVSSYLKYKISRKKSLYWDLDTRSEATGLAGILIGVSDSPGENVPGCYFQGRSGIILGGYNYIAPSVCFVSENHDPSNLVKSIKTRPILIGAYNWFGFGCVVLPGIQIGDHVVVGANAVVTKDVPSYSIIAGNPAKIIKSIDPAGVVKYKDKHELYGFIPKNTKLGTRYDELRKKILRDYQKNYGEILSETLRHEAAGDAQ